MAESNPKRNAGRWLEDLGGGAVVEALTRSIIEHCLNPCKLNVANVTKIRAFGQEHSQQTIGLFVGAAFPRAVGMGEVDGHVQVLFELFEPAELGAVVQRRRAA